jgi:hypothetical protein
MKNRKQRIKNLDAITSLCEIQSQDGSHPGLRVDGDQAVLRVCNTLLLTRVSTRVNREEFEEKSWQI